MQQAHHFTTIHASKRAFERLEIEKLEVEVGSLFSLIKHTVYLKQIRINDQEQQTYRLFFSKTIEKFAIFIIYTKLANKSPSSHNIITTITTEMYEERNKDPITQKQFALAASLVLNQIEYRNWSKIEFGRIFNLHEHRLLVYFDKNTKPRSIKVRSSNCDEFKKYENPYAVLTHPGAITMANKQLLKIGKTLNDRLYMRYDGDSGPLKLYGKSAIKCPYCGMDPLPTDITAEKISEDSK